MLVFFKLSLDLFLVFIAIDRSEFHFIVSVDLISFQFSIARSIVLCFEIARVKSFYFRSVRDSIIPYCDCVRSVVSTLLTSDLLFNLFETDRSSLVSLKSDSLGCFDRLIVSNSWHSCCLSYKEFQILIKIFCRLVYL